MKVVPVVFLVLSVISCNSVTANNNTDATTDTIAARKVTETTLNVIPSPTLDPKHDSIAKNFTYPATFTLNDTVLKGQLAAFGAAYKVWLGPKEWIGRGAIGAEGDILVTLLPPNGHFLNGPYIVYSDISSCKSCILFSAAQYFPEALAKYNAEYNKDNAKPVEIPKGLEVKQVSPGVMTYSKPWKKGMVIRGVVSYTETGHYYEAEFALPQQHSELGDVLVKAYIEQIRQKRAQ